jgi:hypothetical protein
MRFPDLRLRCFLQTAVTIAVLVTAGALCATPDSAFLRSNPPVASTNIATTNAVASTPTTTKEQDRKIDLPIPVGEPVKGIKIPQYDENGALTMNLSAETARKLDEKQVEFGKLKIDFNDKDEKTIAVEIPHSILDMETKKLIADSETVIHREDFEIVGQTAEFDTITRSGTFKGRVHASFRNGETADLP